ncbi:hypothetical protein ACP4OV_022634 [Aristida adscensionis]
MLSWPGQLGFNVYRHTAIRDLFILKNVNVACSEKYQQIRRQAGDRSMHLRRFVMVAEGHDETYSFDTATGAWRKVGDWALPFMGRAEYVAEHGLWFGLSSALAAGTPTVDASDLTPGGNVWKWQGLAVSSDELSAEHEDSYLVPLGQLRLCVARFFEEDYDDGMCVMLSGVEVVRDTGPKCGLRMLLHQAKRYSLLGEVSRRFCRVF